MKYIPLVALVLLAGCTAKPVSTPNDPKIDIAQKYVTAVFAVDIKSLDAAEDKTMQGAMNKGDVANLVQMIVSYHGKLRSTGEARVGKIQAYDVVYIPCTFDRDPLDAKVVFDSNQKVTGFFFVAPGGL